MAVGREAWLLEGKRKKCRSNAILVSLLVVAHLHVEKGKMRTHDSQTRECQQGSLLTYNSCSQFSPLSHATPHVLPTPESPSFIPSNPVVSQSVENSSPSPMDSISRIRPLCPHLGTSPTHGRNFCLSLDPPGKRVKPSPIMGTPP